MNAREWIFCLQTQVQTADTVGAKNKPRNRLPADDKNRSVLRAARADS